MEIEGKVVLVTGGGGGIGSAIAQAFLEKGARVAISDIDIAHAQAEAESMGGGVLALSHDVTSAESWAAVRQDVEAKLGPVDVVCNNAGVSLPFKPLEEVAPEEFDRVMAINVRGVYLGCLEFISAFKARRSGHIVNTSSVNGQIPHGTFAAYSASKFAVSGLSEALRQELAPFGVGVSILYPGLTRSRMSQAQAGGLPPEMRKATEARMMEAIWLGRAVVHAVEANRLHIITHPEHLPALQARIDELLSSFGAPAQPGYAGGAFGKA